MATCLIFLVNGYQNQRLIPTIEKIPTEDAPHPIIVMKQWRTAHVTELRVMVQFSRPMPKSKN